MPDTESTLTETEATTTFEAANRTSCTEKEDGSHVRTGCGHVTIGRVATGDSPYSNIDTDLNIKDEDLVDFNNFNFGADDDLDNINISSTFSVNDFTNNVVIHTTKTEEHDAYTVTGSGLFDIMMDTATKHLTAQYEAGRIRGEDYAAGYVEIYKATLTTAASLWSTLPKLKAEILQAKAQALLAKAQAISAIAESKYAYVNAKARYYLSLAQAKETEAKIEQTQLQSVVAVETAKLTAAQVCTQEAETKEKAKQLELIDAQIKEEEAKRRLLNRQAEGFGEDYKQKILKMLLDTWQVVFTTSYDGMDTAEEVRDSIPKFISAPNMNAVFEKYIKDELDYNIKSNPYADTDFMQTPPTVVSEPPEESWVEIDRRSTTITANKFTLTEDNVGTYTIHNSGTIQDPDYNAIYNETDTTKITDINNKKFTLGTGTNKIKYTLTGSNTAGFTKVTWAKNEEPDHEDEVQTFIQDQNKIWNNPPQE